MKCVYGSAGGRAGVRYVITKLSLMDSLPNFLTHGAPLRALRARELRYDLCDYKSLPWVVLVTVSSIYVFSEPCVLPAGKELLLDKRRLNLCETFSLHLNRTLF